MRKLMVTIASLISSISVSSAEIANDKVRIGLLSDLSGPYEADTGNGSVSGCANCGRRVWKQGQWCADRDFGG